MKIELLVCEIRRERREGGKERIGNGGSGRNFKKGMRERSREKERKCKGVGGQKREKGRKRE